MSAERLNNLPLKYSLPARELAVSAHGEERVKGYHDALVATLLKYGYRSMYTLQTAFLHDIVSAEVPLRQVQTSFDWSVAKAVALCNTSSLEVWRDPLSRWKTSRSLSWLETAIRVKVAEHLVKKTRGEPGLPKELLETLQLTTLCNTMWEHINDL